MSTLGELYRRLVLRPLRYSATAVPRYQNYEAIVHPRD